MRSKSKTQQTTKKRPRGPSQYPRIVRDANTRTRIVLAYWRCGTPAERRALLAKEEVSVSAVRIWQGRLQKGLKNLQPRNVSDVPALERLKQQARHAELVYTVAHTAHLLTEATTTLEQLRLQAAHAEATYALACMTALIDPA